MFSNKQRVIVLITCVTLATTMPVWSWGSGKISVDVSESPLKIAVKAGNTTLAEISGFVFGSRTISSITGQKQEGDNLILDLGDGEKLVISPATNGIRFFSSAANRGNVEIVIKDLGGHFFGCRSQFVKGEHSPDLRGKTSVAHVQSGGSFGETNEVVWNANLGGPVFYCTRGYGSFFNTFAKGEYHFAQNGKTRLTHETDTLDWYVFYGPTADPILEGMYTIIGKPKKRTIWGMGPAIWRNENKNSQQIIDDCRGFTDAEIPLTMLWLDRPYSDGGSKEWNEMNFNYKFANPSEWIGQLRDDFNLLLSTWIYYGVFGETIDECGGSDLDFSKPACIKWYQDRITERQYTHGVVRHKMDDRFRSWYCKGFLKK